MSLHTITLLVARCRSSCSAAGPEFSKASKHITCTCWPSWPATVAMEQWPGVLGIHEPGMLYGCNQLHCLCRNRGDPYGPSDHTYAYIRWGIKHGSCNADNQTAFGTPDSRPRHVLLPSFFPFPLLWCAVSLGVNDSCHWNGALARRQRALHQLEVLTRTCA